MASDLLQKYVWLVDALLTRSLTFEEINEKWRSSSLYNGKDIPLRTFHHQRGEIFDLFGIEIVCDKLNGYTYGVENSTEVKQSQTQKWLLNTFAVSNALNESAAIKDRVLVDEVPSAQHFLADIIRAMRGNLAISVLYHPFWAELPFSLLLQPYFVKMHEERWYLYAKRENEDIIKLYALDRMEEVKATKKKFRLPRDFSPQEYLCNSIGVVVKDDIGPCEIQLKAFGIHANYLRTLPLHHSQEEIEKHKDYTVFKYYLCPTDEFYQKILAQREWVQVVSPKKVCKELNGIINLMKKYYGN